MPSFARPRQRALCLPLLFTLVIMILLAVTPPTAGADWTTVGWKTVFQPIDQSPTFKTVSDGAGGMLVMMNDPGAESLPLSISRLDHTGNRLWGPDGVSIPFEVGSDGMSGPFDIVADGAQGAYCIYSWLYGSDQIVVLSRVAADGAVLWTRPVGDYGPGPVPAVSLIKSDNGDLLVSWNRSVGTMDLELITTRLDSEGHAIWEATVWEDANNSLDQLDWVVESDGLGGVVFGINYQSFSGLPEQRVQRLAENGSLMWGTRGTQVFAALGSVVDVLPDNAGGAYVMNAMGWGDTHAQHVDVTGGATWLAGGVQVLNLNDWPTPSVPQFCVDGGGGFFAVDGVTDLFAQHVDINGNLTWGAAGLQITTLAGDQINPSLANDGFGGMVVAYQDYYYTELSDNQPHALSAVRLDGYGTKVWETTGFWWGIVNNQAEDVIADPQIVADGSGGAQVSWRKYDGDHITGEILATGLGPDGTSPPVPSLTYINPDAGSIGEVQPVLILGDYLDASQDFALTRADAADVTVTGVTVLSGQLVAGTLDLAGARLGAYNLKVTDIGGRQAMLSNAYGVGEMVPCDQDEPGVLPDAPPLPFGSQRRMAIDSQGRTVAAWIDYHEGQYFIVWNQREPDGTEHQVHVYSSVDPLSDISFALGPNDEYYFAYVRNAPGGDLICEIEGSLNAPQISELPLTGDGRNPVLVVDAAEQRQIVYQVDNGGVSDLYHVAVNSGGFDTPTFLNAGANAGSPDLTRDGSGLMLTFVRDLWWPGLREVCYQHFNGAAWEAPVGMYFGVEVKSPSVAWDGADQLLFSWVLDNSGTFTAPLLHTLLMDNHVAGAVRWRAGLPIVYRCSVASNLPGNFQLLTLESDGGLPLQVYLRSGNGEVFYPRRRLNSNSDVDFPYFCTRSGANGVAVMWDDYTDPMVPLYRFNCDLAGGISAVEMPGGAVGAGAYPNPFNPSTTLYFSQRANGWVRLAIYDVAGRRVRALVDGIRAAGNHAVTWDGRDGTGHGLPSGVYFGRLQLAGEPQPLVIKLTLVK